MEIKWFVLALAVLMYALVIVFQNKKVWFSLCTAFILIVLGIIFPSAISFIAREAAYNCLRRSVSVSKLIKEDIPFDSSQLIIETEDFEKSYTALHSKKA